MLPLLDLNQAIEAQIEINPLLEIDEEKLSETRKNEANDLDNNLNKMISSNDLPYFHETEEDGPDQKPFNKAETLEDKLLKQLRVDFSDELSLKIGEYIIGNIDEDGYLTVSCEEIAEHLNLPEIRRVEDMLLAIQTFEPHGIAARDLQECLLIQVRYKIHKHQELATLMVKNYLQEMAQKKYQEIARKLKVKPEMIKTVTSLIASLEPRPARNHRPVEENIYIKPDVTIYQDEDKSYHIHLNKDGLPPLRINQQYKRLIREGRLTAEEKAFLKQQMQNAVLFIRSIEQRGHTVRRITEYILEKQKNFFNEGHSGLSPMSLKDVAQALDRNESTISRAINNKHIDTPQGLFPMKFFFSQSVGKSGNSDGGAAGVSNRHIKEQIKYIIDQENKNAPLSDAEIQFYFDKRGMKIARRTIAKYRQVEKILPAYLRKH